MHRAAGERRGAVIVTTITQIQRYVRERMPDITDRDVLDVAEFIWGEARDLGLRLGENWQPLFDAMPRDMSDYYEFCRWGDE